MPKPAGAIRGPQISDMQTVEHPMGDVIPMDPLADEVFLTLLHRKSLIL